MLRLSRRNLLRGSAALAVTKLFTPSIARAGFALGKAGGGGGGDYVAKVVSFPPSVEMYQTEAPDTFSQFTALFAVEQDSAGFNIAQVVVGNGSINITPNNNSAGDIEFVFDGPDGGSALVGSIDGAVTAGELYEVFISADVNHPAGEKIFHLLINGVDVLDPTKTVDNGDAFTIGFGNPVIIPDFSGEPHPTHYSDFQLWYGSAINPTGHLDKIVLGVDPTLVAAQFGAQSVLLSGDKTAFLTNQGSEAAWGIRYTNAVNGLNGAGSLTLPSVQLGATLVSAHYFDGGTVDVTADFEPVITIAGHIQQTSSDDLSGFEVTFTLSATLSDA